VNQVKEQVDGEVGVLQDSLNRIRTAAVRYEMASKALHNLSVHPAGFSYISWAFFLSVHLLLFKISPYTRFWSNALLPLLLEEFKGFPLSWMLNEDYIYNLFLIFKYWSSVTPFCCRKTDVGPSDSIVVCSWDSRWCSQSPHWHRHWILCGSTNTYSSLYPLFGVCFYFLPLKGDCKWWRQLQ